MYTYAEKLSEWKAGYTGEINGCKITVEDGGTVTVKAGTFDNCIKVTLVAELPEDINNYWDNGYSYVYCGVKKFWYVPDVGIVKHTCDWEEGFSSSCELSEYNSVSDNGEYMPVYIGNRWVYDETTIENRYIARRVYNVVHGIGDSFMISDEQYFTFKGTEKEYNDWKENIKN